MITSADADRYETALRGSDSVLLYTSASYWRFLEHILTGCQASYLGAWEGSTLVGVLPAFVRQGRYGAVLNSLPFYGSNGGAIVTAPDVDGVAVKRALLSAFDDLGHEQHVAASTIITNPLDADHGFYEANWSYTLRDERIGQITILPSGLDDASDVEHSLMESFHQKTRNSIRKAQKSGFFVKHDASRGALERLAELHYKNIGSLGGLPKPQSVFLTIRNLFEYDRDYRVYTAERDGEIAAALLVFFYHRTAEYFTPAVAQAYRSLQPMSLLALVGMQEAARRGCRYWNWGGTWRSQTGVHRFKSRFGAEERPYYYFVREYSRTLRRLTAPDLLQEYPYFYVLPFSVLSPDARGASVESLTIDQSTNED